MRILMVIGQFYPTIGGAEQQCWLLSKSLQRKGHAIRVLTVQQERSAPLVEVIDGIFIKRVCYPIFYLFGKRIGLGLLAPWIMLWHVYKNVSEYDIIHVHQALWPAFVSALVGRMRGKPIVCKLGNSGKRFDLQLLQKNHIYGFLAKMVVKKYVNNFTWTSQAVYDDLKKERISDKKLTYIPNGVELNIRTSNFPKRNKKIRFIYTGTLTPKKNLPTLIEAINNLSLTYRERMQCVILGSGPEQDMLTELIKRYKLGNIILMVKSVKNVAEYLDQSDVFILPSLTEGLSNSVLEAMAHGLALVLSHAGGNLDLISKEDSNGLFIDPDNIDSLVKAIKYMIDHPEQSRAMGRASRKVVEEKYSIEKVVHQYEQLYQHCLLSHLS